MAITPIAKAHNMSKSTTYVTVRCNDGIQVAVPAKHIKPNEYSTFLASTAGWSLVLVGSTWQHSCNSDLVAALPGAFYIK